MKYHLLSISACILWHTSRGWRPVPTARLLLYTGRRCRIDSLLITSATSLCCVSLSVSLLLTMLGCPHTGNKSRNQDQDIQDNRKVRSHSLASLSMMLTCLTMPRVSAWCTWLSLHSNFTSLFATDDTTAYWSLPLCFCCVPILFGHDRTQEWMKSAYKIQDMDYRYVLSYLCTLLVDTCQSIYWCPHVSLQHRFCKRFLVLLLYCWLVSSALAVSNQLCCVHVCDVCCFICR